MNKTVKKKEEIIVTGAAGFIGFHLSNRLISQGYKVICLDNLNNYYDVKLKEARLKELQKTSRSQNNEFLFYKSNIENLSDIEAIFSSHNAKVIFHLAAQAGVRYSLENPSSYISSNIVGFSNILELCKSKKVRNLIYASSSSVYGGNHKIPFCEKDPVNHPVSLYAATKKSNELMAHCYSHLYNLPTTGLRFFTVYGPWGRPDMAPMIFTKSILEGKPIKIFNYGEMERDFTYIEDIVEVLINLIDKPAQINKDFDRHNPEPSSSWAPYKIFNLGNSQKIKLLDFIDILEKEIGKKAIKEFTKMQPGDVKATAADTYNIKRYTDLCPYTEIKTGVKKFINWYKSYYS